MIEGPITGKTLIEWGYTPGPWFGEAIDLAERKRLAGDSEQEIRDIVEACKPPPPINLKDPISTHREFSNSGRINIYAENQDEEDNVASVISSMSQLMRVPTIHSGSIMPDACPAGPHGTIPVGGVVAAKNAIHPGMHSSDVCCSVAVTVFPDMQDPLSVLDAGMKLSHFGGGGRPEGKRLRPPSWIMRKFDENLFLKDLTDDAIAHFGTQGDGNHFFYVGRVRSSGHIALVTHHGSRRPGAMLYKAGMKAAQKNTMRVAPEVNPRNAWLWADSSEGREYWNALQIIRVWTRSNHFVIHELVRQYLMLPVLDRFWNEHNFVFRKSDGLFYHAKGATPAFAQWADDADGRTLIPLNMAEPILVTRGLDADSGLGFAPHGAGRNFSRSKYMRRNSGKSVEELVTEQTQGIDCRFFSGHPDATELPEAYKNAKNVRKQIDHYGLAEVIDEIDPIGCIMAGDWQKSASWRRKKDNGDDR